MKLPRFQFRLRTLMIAVTLLAVPLGYIGWQAKIVRERRDLLDEIERSGGGYVEWSGQPAIELEKSTVMDGPIIEHGNVPKNWVPILIEKHDEPSTIRRWLGDKIVLMVNCISATPDRASRIRAAFSEAEVLKR